MSRTYKKFSLHCLRHPRGRKQAIINGARPGAIPPDSWEDVPMDKHCYMVWRVTETMKENGISKDVIRRKLKRKWHLQSWEITYIFSYVFGRRYHSRKDNLDNFDFTLLDK